MLERIAVPQVIVPVSHWDRAALRAIAYARSISTDVTVLVVGVDGDAEAVRRRIRIAARDVPIVSRKPEGLAAYLDERERADPERPITVVLADLVPKRRWSYPLHADALGLKVRLFFRPNTVVVDVPYHLSVEQGANR